MFDQQKSGPSLVERLGILWCRMVHDSPMWPIRGHYLCRTCGRDFQVPWAGKPGAEPVPELGPAASPYRAAHRLNGELHTLSVD